MKKLVVLSLVMIVFTITGVSTQEIPQPDSQPLTVIRIKAEELMRHNAAEAVQGAAVDANHFYAIVNSAIGQYDKLSGALVKRWALPRDGLVRHLNSCYVESMKLLCANSNYPETPMANSIEVFDTLTMEHVQSYSLGMMEEGTFNWFNRLGEGWIAGFAHYDGTGGVSYKDHGFASIIRYDRQWRRVGGWMLPENLLELLDPMAASGGTIGPDGLLYLTGHDRPEMYVLAAPAMGPKLIHIATIELDAEGQAFAWDRTSDERIVYAISRPARQVRSFRLPEIILPEQVYHLSDAAVLEFNF